jgi:salicylate hydroxylase
MTSGVKAAVTRTDIPTIAIVGSGIGGLALAIGLLAQGVPCLIYEAAAEFSAVGAGVGLGPNALTAINLIDPRFGQMYDSIKTGNKSPGRVHDMFEALLAEEDFGTKQGWNGASVGAAYFQRSSAHRKDLLDIMASFIPEGIIKFNKRVSTITQHEKGATIIFTDGETVDVDAVIGCDGIKGVTRQAVLGEKYPELVASQYSGVYLYRAVVPMEDAVRILGDRAEDAKWFMSNGRSLASYPISKGRELNYVCFIQDKNSWDHKQVTIDVTNEDMIADLEGFDSRLVELLHVSNLQSGIPFSQIFHC